MSRTRLAVASLLAIAGFALPALAQTPAAPAASPPPQVAPAASAAPPEIVAPPPATPPPEAAPAPEAPPAPPPPPTDPGAIRALSILQTVCIPAAHGQPLAGLAKTAGFRKTGENFVLKQPGYQFTLLAQGSNPHQCHVDIIHPADLAAPAKEIVIALHNWAALANGWTLYQNGKNVSGGAEFTTRSWEHATPDENEALVLTTIRKPDGSPVRGNADTSEMIYSATKPAAPAV